MFAAIKAFFDCLCSGFQLSETKTKESGNIYAIKDAKKLQKASDTAEEIIFLFAKYKKYMTPTDQRRFIRLIRKFKQNN